MTEPAHPEVRRDDAARIGRRTVLAGAGLLLGGCTAPAPRARGSRASG
jgi:hypothetical protein